MNAHEIDYRIIGDDIQLVEIELGAGAFSLWEKRQERRKIHPWRMLE